MEKIGIDLTLKVLTEITKKDVDGVMDMDLNFSRRTLYAHHVSKAYQVKNAQMRERARRNKQ